MTPENLDSMLYFLVGEASRIEPGRRELTLVCGERTEAVEQLVRDLESDFQAAHAGDLLPGLNSTSRRSDHEDPDHDGGGPAGTGVRDDHGGPPGGRGEDDQDPAESKAALRPKLARLRAEVELMQLEHEGDVAVMKDLIRGLSFSEAMGAAGDPGTLARRPPEAGRVTPAEPPPTSSRRPGSGAGQADRREPGQGRGAGRRGGGQDPSQGLRGIRRRASSTGPRP